MSIAIREHNNYPWQRDFKIYVVSIFDNSILTIVTSNPTKVAEWIADVKLFRGQSLIVGLDIEWRPYYGCEPNPVAVLQLCVGDRCLIYQIVHSPYIPSSLISFLFDHSNIFVGKDIKFDLYKLANDYSIVGHARYVDLGILAAAHLHNRNDLKYAGLKKLASEVLGREVEKPEDVRRSRWDNRWLTPEQVEYACLDAFISFEIGRVLNASSY